MITYQKARSSRYSFLYWTTFAYLLGLPNFVHFDVTGRVKNAVNATSISNVALAILCGYLFAVVIMLDRRAVIVRRLEVFPRLWLFLLADMIAATLFGTPSQLTPSTNLGTCLALFRIGQFLLAYCLICALLSRTPPDQVARLVTKLIGRLSWTWIMSVRLFLPLIPHQVYGGSDEVTPDAIYRLGGQFIGPATLTLFAGAALFYALLFFRPGLHRWLGSIVCLVTIVLARARAQQAGILIAIVLYTLFLARKPALRWASLAVTPILVTAAFVFSRSLLKYGARGQTLQTLSTLNDRTRVWEAATLAVKHSPILGYGYSIGARNALRDFWTFSHWIPPHAHDEFLQIALDGGIFAAILVIVLYGIIAWRSLGLSRKGPDGSLLFLVMLQLLITAPTGAMLGYLYGNISGLFLLGSIAALTLSASAPSRKGLLKKDPELGVVPLEQEWAFASSYALPSIVDKSQVSQTDIWSAE